MKNVFVRVGFSQKYIIAQVLRVKEDASAAYTLTNGQKCSLFLQLLLTENAPDKLKWFKINQISNVEITE